MFGQIIVIGSEEVDYADIWGPITVIPVRKNNRLLNKLATMAEIQLDFFAK